VDISQIVNLGVGGLAVFLMYKVLMKMLDVGAALAVAIDKNTKATQESVEFLKNLNGQLKKTVQKKINENK
jgi:hypothetical protein